MVSPGLWPQFLISAPDLWFSREEGVTFSEGFRQEGAQCPEKGQALGEVSILTG